MASIVDKENIAKAKDLIEKKDFIGAQIILRLCSKPVGSISTKRSKEC